MSSAMVSVGPPLLPRLLRSGLVKFTLPVALNAHELSLEML